MSEKTDHMGLLSLADRVLMRNYRQQPAVMVRGEGLYLWDMAGNRYLDMSAGIAVSCLGHGHERLSRAIAEQAERLIHASNLYFIERQLRAAEAIVARCFGDRVYFCNSGTEANEAALKLARRFQARVHGAPGRTRFVATTGSFHGRTFGALSITGQDKHRAGFGSLVEPVELLPYGDAAAVRKALELGDVCAVIVEPIQAEGGIVVPPEGYLAELREATREAGALLIFDEVQTGIGRTGRWFGYEHEGVEPDVMTLAKGLGGGVPIGAVVASERAAKGLEGDESTPVPHASTFGGNALACAAAIAVFEAIDDEGLIDNASESGAYLADRLDELARRYPALCTGVRGRGLLQGLVLKQPAGGVVARCRESGLLVSAAGGEVLRFSPPLTVQRSHIDDAVEILDQVLSTHQPS
jgi:acetylornithine/N-succinyldiaminopimelate aminotransferase